MFRALTPTLILLASVWPVSAQISPIQTIIVPCQYFVHHGNGTWSPNHGVTIGDPNGSHVSMGTGVSFGRGVIFGGIPLAELLDAQCIGISPEE